MAKWNLVYVVSSVWNFPLLFSRSKSIRMSTLVTVIITYCLLIINYYYNDYKKSQ